MMLHRAPPSPSTTSTPTYTPTMEALDQPRRSRRKRKAESQDNERLSKRLSLLNLEQNGPKLYVPVETPSVPASPVPAADDTMQLDDSKHKVYIYNIDDELSSDSETDEGKLVFLPDIEKHLRANRIPPSVLANSDGELAGMQLVLYNDPKSLSVPEDKDGVRKAIIESRNRLREQQRLEREGKSSPTSANMKKPYDLKSNDTTPISTSESSSIDVDMPVEDDPDAMDMD